MMFETVAACSHSVLTPNLNAVKPPVNASAKAPASLAEVELIRRILGGDTEAFYELVRPYERAVFWAAFSVLHNQEDAEDAAQDALLKAFSNLSRFRGDSKFSTWLCQIAINQSLMRLRTLRRELHDSLEEVRENKDGEYLPRELADWREIPSETLQKRELHQALAQALISLAPKYESVLVLRDVANFTIAETAGLLGITQCAVKTRLIRARQQMREALAPRIDGSWCTG